MELVEAKFKQTEVGVIPEDWQVKPLGSCLDEQPKYGIGAAAVEYNFNLPTYLRITDIDDDGRIIESDLKSVDHIDALNYYLESGDIVLARTGASVGKSYFYYSEGRQLVYAGFLIRIKSNQKVLLPSYLNAYLKTTVYWRWVNVMSMRSGQPGINSTEYASLPIPLPPTLTEQRAIATALSDVDALITSLDQLIEKKKAIKQGAMQELLTGKTRVAGFGEGVGYQQTEVGVIPEDWEVKILNDVCSEINDGTHHTPHYVENGVPFYSVENVSANNFENVKFISYEEHSSLIKRCHPKKGDILLTRIGTLGITKLIDWDVNASIYVSLALLKTNDLAVPEYVYSYTKSNDFIQNLVKRSLVNATPQKINMGEIGNIPVVLPKSINEQKAIAQILTDMDSRITTLESKRDKYKQIKQGMMQELLTGKTRLI